MTSCHVTELIESATKREWNKFIDIYRRNPAARNAVITNSDETPLHVALSLSAAEHVVEKMLDILLAQGVAEAYECLKMADKEGNTAFHLAASKGAEHVVEKMLDILRAKGVAEAYEFLKMADKEGNTAFHLAASKGYAEHVVEKMLDILLAQGVAEAYECLKMADKERNTAFHLAASKGYARVCRRIAIVDERNKNPLGNMTNVEGDNILQVAFSNEHIDVAIDISNWYPHLVENLVEKQMDIIRRKLFKLAMRGDWTTVVRIYSWIPEVHKAQITKSGNTALHIAVSEGLKEEVLKLVEQIKLSKGTDKADVILKVRNDRGNTALHLAAELGNVKICKSIAEVDKSLVRVRNDNYETPFFLAARHGKKDVFLHLCEDIEGSSPYWRRKDGATILHAAIGGDYYDLAFHIIHLYPKLVNYMDEKGTSPLHLLASKPSAFKSGSYLSSHQNLIYNCIFVDKLKVKNISDPQSRIDWKYPDNYKACGGERGVVLWVRKALQVLFGQSREGAREDTNGRTRYPEKQEDDESEDQRFPPNYTCCFDLVKLFSKALLVILGLGPLVNTNDRPRDLEKQEDDQSEHRHNQRFPPNYTCCFDLVKLFSKVLLVILGLGSSNIEKIREQRKTHTWAVQVMNELLHRTTMYEYEFTGGTPEDGGDVPSLEAAIESTPSVPSLEAAIESTPSDDGHKITEPSDQTKTKTTRETPIPIAAKNGIKEMVEKILDPFPVAIQDEDAKKKNIVLLAVENRQPRVYHVSSVQAAIHTISEPSDQTKTTRKTPILIAAKNGIKEMVENILDLFPVAIQDEDAKKKNIVLLAVENRQPRVYQFLVLREGTSMKESIFRKVDSEGNSALHLAAKLRDYKPWRIPGAAFQMQWEIKWYEYVKKSMPSNFFLHQNAAGKTAEYLFSESHSELVKSGGAWLTNTSQSCSVVAGLIATVAFATAATVPGGVKQESGRPVLESQPAFNVFSIASLVALCFSVTALVMFLSILTSRHEERDFGKGLPRKLLFGLTSLFFSIAAMLVSFCAGHFFVLRDELRFAAYPVYVVTCLPVFFFAMAQLPLYFDLLRASLRSVPERSYMVVST